MNLLITRPSKTSREIARQLGITYSIGGTNGRIENLIRWGTTANRNMRIDKQINTVEAIVKASNKAEFRNLLREHNIPTINEFNGRFPCVGRTAHHERGKGFFYCENDRDVRRARERGAIYFSDYYPKTKEYRIHVAGGKVLLFSEKLHTEPYRSSQTHVWNRRNGYTFRHLYRSDWLENDVLMDMQRSCKDAMELIGLDFGAFDVLAYPTTHSLPPFAICELNTAPSLSPLALEKYIAYFKEAFEEEVEEDGEYI
jgi:hypothetical protein